MRPSGIEPAALVNKLVARGAPPSANEAIAAIRMALIPGAGNGSRRAQLPESTVAAVGGEATVALMRSRLTTLERDARHLVGTRLEVELDLYALRRQHNDHLTPGQPH